MTKPMNLRSSDSEILLFEDLKAIISYSKRLLTGSIIQTELDGITHVKLTDWSIEDWNKLTNFAYFYLTLFTVDKLVFHRKFISFRNAIQNLL